MKLISIILLAIATANSIVCLIEWYGGLIKEIINKDEDKVEELSKAFEIERSLNEVLNNQRAEIDRLKQQISNNSEQDKHMKNNDKQIVYKIEKGDLVGDIKGDNIIVILMNGDINGDISSKEGDVVLIKGDINGDVKANKVICPRDKSEYENYIDKLSSVEKLSKPDKEDNEAPCYQCVWFNSKIGECKSWDANKGECQFIDKYEARDKVKYLLEHPIAPVVSCADCEFSEDINITFSGLNTNKYCNCSKEGGLGLLEKNATRTCVYFKKKNDHTCKSCYHFVKSSRYKDTYYCSKNNLEILTDSNSCCSEYDGTGATSNHQVDCARASNNSGLCFFFCTSGCPIKNGCSCKIGRSEDVKL